MSINPNNNKMRSTIFLTLLLISIQTIAQDKLDHILMLDGENKSGKVVGISEDAVEFIHNKESLKYSIAKSEISKIEFASGRIEVFNEIPSKATENAALVDHHNKIAVLPFTYIRDGEQKKNDAMERKVQQELVSVMQNHVGVLKIQPTSETNALLAKAGINDENFIQFTMPEIANLLGVEYIVQSILTISEEGATTTTTGSTRVKANESRDKLRGSTYNTSSTQLKFDTSVDMSLYNDRGELVWTQSKQSFWPNEDAYQQTLKFLLKRSPIYSK